MASRDELLAVSLHLLAERGYAAFGLREVAAEVGVTTGSIYHHFSSKEDLVRSAVEHYAARVLARQDVLVASEASARDRLWSVVDWLAGGDADTGWRRDFSLVVNVELRKVAGFERLYGRLRSAFTRVVREPLRDGVASGELALPEGATLDDVVSIVMAGIVGALQMQARGSLRVPLDRQLRLHMATILRSLQPPRRNARAATGATEERRSLASERTKWSTRSEGPSPGARE